MTRAVERWCAAAVCLLVCGIAAWAGIRTTHDLDWPGGQDFSRDIAAAETIAGGHPFSDQFYLDETLWYNPLVPAAAATAAAVTRHPIHTVYARLGAYLNLLAPL